MLVQSGTQSWSAGTFFTPGAPQMGTAVTLDTLASRIQNAVYRNGEIWLALTSDPDSDSKSEVVWQRIATNGGSPSAPTVTDAGFIDGSDGNEWTFMPAVSVNVLGDAAIVYSQSFTDQFPDMRYVTRAAGDAAGTFQASMVAATSPGFYSAFFTPANDRWGDYAAAVVDPDDDQTFCVAQEKVLAAASAGSVIWDTFIGCFSLTTLCAPPASGDWTVTQDCTLSQDATAAANVIVNENVALTIAAGVGLNIDLSTFLLTVKTGAKVVIKPGGKIF